MKKNNSVAVASAIAMTLFSGFALADDTASSIVNPVAELFVSIGYLVGLILFVLGLYGFKKNSESPQQYPMSYCIANLTTGTLLLLSGYFYGVVRNTAVNDGWSYDNSSALALDKTALANSGNITNSFLGQYLPVHTVELLIGFIYLVGLLAFLKGIYMLKSVGSASNNGSDGIGKALTHICGGVVSMNILSFSCLVSSIIGVSMICLG
ncbi:hypothetical protein [Aeromonas sp. MrichA-1]|uniref:hypothetical protein n=1 Tax=Aeromonas TaxID=642 RepID=UPI001B333E73|nr:hypothetical protein [Aeromonas sp. MrichA-1]MBP4081433.1 hypothetical protein [Aeromonas sp. MrichA-1]